MSQLKKACLLNSKVESDIFSVFLMKTAAATKHSKGTAAANVYSLIL